VVDFVATDWLSHEYQFAGLFDGILVGIVIGALVHLPRIHISRFPHIQNICLFDETTWAKTFS